MKPSPFPRLGRRLIRLCAGGALLAGLALTARQAHAQAPAAPVAAPAAPGQEAPAQAAGKAPGEWYWRIGFLTLDQWAFKTHPYAQITGASPFDNGRAAIGGSFLIGAPESDANSLFLVQILHSLPPFSVEIGRPLEMFLPKGISFGFDYYYFGQDGSSAGKGGTVPPIKTDTYLYQFDVRAFAFDPTQPGLNYYAGIGVGTLQGKMTAQPYADQSPSVIDYSQPLTGSFIFGVEAKGESFGLRYELNLLSANSVELDSNPYPNSTQKKIDFSGTITRFSIFYQF